MRFDVYNMMGEKKFLLGVIMVFMSFLTSAQILKPASWSYATDKAEAAIGEEVNIIFKADIHPDWYLYSSDFSCEVGPIVTSFTFEESNDFELVGGIRPIGAKKKYDDIFECEYTYFTGTGEFQQTVKVLNVGASVRGIYEYQVCTDIDGKCISFDDEFSIAISTIASKNEVPVVIESPVKPDQNLADNQTDLQPEDKPEQNQFSEPIEEIEQPDTYDANDINNSPGKHSYIKEGDEYPTVKLDPFYPDDYEKPKVSHLWFMIAAFLAGLAALVTPCVFPMIPMTVSFFTGGGENRTRGKFQALFYGLSIILIYTIVGAAIAPLMGPSTANDLATEWLPNVIFFAVFFLFALSFFGMFDIVIPSSVVNNMDKQADKGGLLGPFFMAFTLVLVSFSCTGPIVSTILVASAGGEVVKPVLGMLAFGAAFAIPFTLFAFFPGWVSKLPKSGGWLNSVKVVLGFIELALAFKFLSIADQAFHWGILDREVNIAIWVVIFSTMGFYLLGKIKLPHDSEMQHIGVPRLLMAIVTFSFVVYMIPGLFGAPLKALAGYLPPMSTHDFNVAGLIRENGNDTTIEQFENCDDPKYADFLHLPHGINGYFDFDQALACARAQNKPIFIDFTGHGCVNCREMEAVVWSESKVLKKLKEDFVVVALYVDDKTELPSSEWYISEYDNKIKKTIGKQNADFQIQRADANAQPNYFVIDHNAKSLNTPIARSGVDEFLAFLNEGLANFKQQQKEVLAKE